MRNGFALDSNDTLESDSHSQKQCPQIRCTDGGRQIDGSDEHKLKANLPIRKSFEPDSNVTSESAVQLEKHSEASS
jgi:hypothetical protein